MLIEEKRPQPYATDLHPLTLAVSRKVLDGQTVFDHTSRDYFTNTTTRRAIQTVR